MTLWRRTRRSISCSSFGREYPAYRSLGLESKLGDANISPATKEMLGLERTARSKSVISTAMLKGVVDHTRS